MSMQPDETTDGGRKGRVDLAIAEYLAAADLGQPIPREAWLGRHPDLAGELTAFLAARADPGVLQPTEVDPLVTTRMAPGAEGPDPSTDPTLPGLPEDALPAAIRVRYFGDFELAGVLGRGGMGIVYLAHQISLNRPVALKMIRSGRLADESELRRFRNEAEAIARLDHPNLLSIFEVGEFEGQSYFTMPLIRGGSLADDPRPFRDDPRRAATLMGSVADAVHHAHQRGILHRDLKPANVLVDELGRPLVSDFGLAKRIDDQESTSGAILGTPAYMAPELASGKPGGATTASDIYGLGAILYAILTGRAPFAGSSVVETLRHVCDDPPDRPSAINPRVDRRLEAICLKALEKEPSLRYSSAFEMAEDLRRWLAGRSVRARPASPVTRLALWCRRNPVPAALSAFLCGSVAVGSAVATWQYRAGEEQRRVGRLVDLYFREAFIGLNDPLTFAYERASTDVSSLDRAVASIGDRFADDPDVEADIRDAVGGTYRALGRPDRAEVQMREALRLRVSSSRARPVDLATARRELASLLISIGKADEGGKLALEALGAYESLLGPGNAFTLIARTTVAEWHLADRRPSESAKACREILRAADRLDRPDPKLKLVARLDLALALIADGHPDEADQQFEASLQAARDARVPDDHPLSLNLFNSYAASLIVRGRYERAGELLSAGIASAERGNDPGSVEFSKLLSNLVGLRYLLKDYVGAEVAATRAIEIQSRTLPASDPALLNNRHVLADLLFRRLDWAGAEAQYAALVRSRPPGVPVDPATELAEAAQHADSLLELDRPRDAIAILDRKLPAFRARADAEAKATPSAKASTEARKALARVLMQEGSAHLALGDLDRASAALETSRNLRALAFGESDWRTASIESLLGELAARRGLDDDAEVLLARSLKIIEPSAAPGRTRDKARRRLDDFRKARSRPDPAGTPSKPADPMPPAGSVPPAHPAPPAG